MWAGWLLDRQTCSTGYVKLIPSYLTLLLFVFYLTPFKPQTMICVSRRFASVDFAVPSRCAGELRASSNAMKSSQPTSPSRWHALRCRRKVVRARAQSCERLSMSAQGWAQKMAGQTRVVQSSAGGIENYTGAAATQWQVALHAVTQRSRLRDDIKKMA